MRKTVTLPIAGFLAISLNTVMLKLAKPLGFIAESGGLLNLILLSTPKQIRTVAFLHSQCFWYLFHYFTGAAMVALYDSLFERFKIPTFWKGVLFSLFPWLVNGLIVLPLLNQGDFGITILPATGIIYYFFANGLFGVSLACLNEWFINCKQSSI